MFRFNLFRIFWYGFIIAFVFALLSIGSQAVDDPINAIKVLVKFLRGDYHATEVIGLFLDQIIPTQTYGRE